MRVLHVDPERGWGGGQVQVMGLLRALAARGVEQRLAADPRGRLAADAAAAGVAVVPLAIRNHADVLAGLRLRRLARSADVVHFHTARAHAMTPFVGRHGGRLRRVVTRRMDYVPAGGPYARWLYNRGVDRVIAIADGVRAALVRAGVEPAQIRVVPSGVDPAALVAAPGAREAVRREWQVPDDAVLVALMGVLEARKGHAVLLQAAAAAHATAPQLHYVCCGDGSARAALVAAATGNPAAVRFVGFRDDVAACLAAADIVVLPSLHEGLGVAALEGMAAGRAVVASRVGGLAETVVDDESGVLVPPGDAAALAAALVALAGDPARRARLGAGGVARVAARFTVARMAAGTLACYEEVA